VETRHLIGRETGDQIQYGAGRIRTIDFKPETIVLAPHDGFRLYNCWMRTRRRPFTAAIAKR
jgi:hypothetical protein